KPHPKGRLRRHPAGARRRPLPPKGRKTVTDTQTKQQEQTDLPTFATPEAAAIHYRAELGISGKPTAHDAWRLASRFGEGMRLHEVEDPYLVGIIVWAAGDCDMEVMKPEAAPIEERADSILKGIAFWLMHAGIPTKRAAELTDEDIEREREWERQNAEAFVR